MLPESSKKTNTRISVDELQSFSEISPDDIGSISDISLPTPPDGGWGWVIVLGSFLTHLIADGCAFSFGVLYVELLDYFKEGKGTTAWIGSLFVSVPLIAGPLASAFTNRYGCRVTTICGGLITCVGFVLSSFANSVGMLCFTFGFISGIGLALVYVPAVIIVAYYFEKRRAFATGIAVAGSGIGTFIFAPLTDYLIKEYSWRGAVLIIGGIMLNIVACGAVFRPLDIERRLKTPLQAEQVGLILPSTSQSNRSERTLHEKKLQFDNMLNNKNASTVGAPMIHSLLQFPTYLQSESMDLDRPQSLNVVKKPFLKVNDFGSTQSFSEQSPNGNAKNNKPKEGINYLKKKPVRENSLSLDEQVYITSNGLFRFPLYFSDRFRPLSRKDIFYRGKLNRTTGLSFVSRTASCPDIVMKSQTQIQVEMEENDIKTSCIKFSAEVKHIIKEMLDTSLMRSPVFVYFSISCMLLYMWYDVPYLYAPDKAIEMGISEDQASILVSIIGIVSTFGQIIVGYLGDLPYVNALQFYNVLISLAGIVTVIVPVITSYTGLCLYTASFGFFISGNYALTTIILVDLLSMEKLTNAYGLIMLAEGLSNLIGPPIAGWLYDITGSYDLTFYISGSGILLSGLMLTAIPVMICCSRSRICHFTVQKSRNASTDVSTSSSSACSPKTLPCTSFLEPPVSSCIPDSHSSITCGDLV